MKKIFFKDEESTMVTSNVVGHGKSSWPSTTKVTNDGVFRSSLSHSKAREEEEFSDTCLAIVESKTNNLASELEVSINMAETSGQGGVEHC